MSNNTLTTQIRQVGEDKQSLSVDIVSVTETGELAGSLSATVVNYRSPDRVSLARMFAIAKEIGKQAAFAGMLKENALEDVSLSPDIVAMADMDDPFSYRSFLLIDDVMVHPANRLEGIGSALVEELVTLFPNVDHLLVEALPTGRYIANEEAYIPNYGVNDVLGVTAFFKRLGFGYFRSDAASMLMARPVDLDVPVFDMDTHIGETEKQITLAWKRDAEDMLRDGSAASLLPRYYKGGNAVIIAQIEQALTKKLNQYCAVTNPDRYFEMLGSQDELDITTLHNFRGYFGVRQVTLAVSNAP